MQINDYEHNRLESTRPSTDIAVLDPLEGTWEDSFGRKMFNCRILEGSFLPLKFVSAAIAYHALA